MIELIEQAEEYFRFRGMELTDIVLGKEDMKELRGMSEGDKKLLEEKMPKLGRIKFQEIKYDRFFLPLDLNDVDHFKFFTKTLHF